MPKKIKKEGGFCIKIKCKKTHRFLCEINIEEYLNNLEELGVSQEIPLELRTRCKACREDEIYLIYKDHYIYKTLDKN